MVIIIVIIIIVILINITDRVILEKVGKSSSKEFKQHGLPLFMTLSDE